MNLLIGDIGNTNTKICLVEEKEFKIKKIVYIDSKNINSSKYLISIIQKIIQKKHINKVALFSSVVPKYFLVLKKIFNNVFNIKLKEIKEKKIKK